MKKTTLVIVDDHQLVREMMSLVFSTTRDFEVMGEAGALQEAVDMIQAKRPDLVLLDINLSSESGFDAIPLIRKFSPATRIIGMSMHSQPAYARKMIKMGASGYITKNSPRQEIFKAIEEVRAGRVYICSEIKNILSEQTFHTDDARPDLNSLSMREMEIIDLIREGYSSKEIAARLYISVKTVEVHRYNVLKKLNLKNAAALVNFVFQNPAIAV
jgi:two-component system invasion response regulator UvrY